MDGRRRDGSIHGVIADKFRDVPAWRRLRSKCGLAGLLQTPAGKERSISFRLSAPSFCDLEDSSEEQTLRGYLPAWGIEKNANSLATAA